MKSRHLALIGIGLSLAAFAIAFQNCDQKLSTELRSHSNGQGYDGKLFAHLDQTGQCSNDAVDSAIRFRGGTAYLVRDNCQDIPADQQIAVQSQISYLTPYTILYNDRVYFAWLSSLSKVDSHASGTVVMTGVSYKLMDRSYSGQRHFIATRDSAGNANWIKGHSWFEGPVGATALENAVVLTANVTSSGPAHSDSVWLSKLGSAGVPIWNKSLQVSAAMGTLAVDSVIGLPDNSLIALGHVRRSNATSQLVFAKISADGNLIGAQTISSGDSVGTALFRSASNDIYFSLVKDQVPVIGRLNNNGQVAWSLAFPQYASVKAVSAIQGRLLVVATSYSTVSGGFSLPNYRFLLFDNTGNLLTTKKWLADQTIAPAPQFSASADGGFLAQVDNGNHQATYTHFDDDLNLSWSLNYPLPTETEILRTISMADGRTGQLLTANSMVLVSPQSSTTYQTSILRTIEIAVGCPGCTPSTPEPIQSVTNPGASVGPDFSSSTELSLTDCSPPPFDDLGNYFLE